MRNLLRMLLFMVVLVAVSLIAACGDDEGPIIPECKSCDCAPTFCEDLTHKTDVLARIEFAYNKRRADAYDALLDDTFTFFYTDGDVNGGTPVQWGRDVEAPATSALINGADSIVLTLDWRKGVTWSQQVSGSETWYFTTVFYHFTIKIGETTYIPNQGAKAQFTVRNDGTEEEPRWKLVEMRDLGSPSLAIATAFSTEPTTWGQVKGLFR